MERFLGRRYVIFASSLFVISMGVGIITHASLGTSPITSIPYSLSMVFPQLTFGNFTIIYFLILIFLQWILMGRDITSTEKVNLLLEVVVAFCFGYLVDFGMWVFTDLNPVEYWLKIVTVVIGIIVIAFGVYLQIVADVVMVPADGFIFALTMRLRKKYSIVRVTSDSTMVLVSALIGLAALGTLGGVREGTIISCLITGIVARQFMNRLEWLTGILVPGKSLNSVANGGGEDAIGS